MFGQYCSGKEFAYDKYLAIHRPRLESPGLEDSQDAETASAIPSSICSTQKNLSSFINSSPIRTRTIHAVSISSHGTSQDRSQSQRRAAMPTPAKPEVIIIEDSSQSSPDIRRMPTKRKFEDSVDLTPVPKRKSKPLAESPSSSQHQHRVYQQMLENISGSQWTGIPLICTGDNHSLLDKEL